MRKVSFLSILFAFMPFYAWPEHKTASGIIIDQKNNMVVGAVVMQYLLPDTIKMGNAISDENGQFKIYSSSEVPADARFLLKVRCWGYKEITIEQENDSVCIVLEDNAEEMKEVVITGTQRSFTRELGKFVYVPGSLERELPSSYDLLSFTPMVNILDNAVSIVGKGSSTIYINGRRPNMTNDMVLKYLRSVPTKKIEKIEIITAPDVSHSASTQGGIINIIMKPLDQGIMGNVGVQVGYRNKRFSPQITNFYSFSKKKFNATAYLGYFLQNALSEMQTSYFYKATGMEWNSLSDVDSRVHTLAGNLSMTYDLTKKSILGWSGSFNFMGAKTTSDWTNTYSQEGAEPYQTLSNERQKSPFRHPQLGTKLYYNLRTDERGSNLDLSVSYATTNDSTGRRVNTDERQFQQNTNRNSYGVNAKAKYTNLFKDRSSLNFGYEYSYGNVTHDLSLLDFMNGQWVNDRSQSNIFDYEEHINSGYVSYSRSWSKVVSSRIGARIEQTHVSGYQRATDERFSNKYTDFIPQASLVLNMAEGKHSLSLDYSRRLYRPFYETLNPFQIWTTETSYSRGNPYLTASHLNALNIIYSLKHSYVFGLLYNLTNNSNVGFTHLIDENTTEDTYANFGKSHIAGFYSSVNQTLFKGRWIINGKVEVYYTRYDAKPEYSYITDDHWSAEFLLQNMLLLSRKQNIQLRLSYLYHTPSHGPTYIRDRHINRIYLSLNKRFKKGCVLSLDVNDLLYTQMHEKFNCADYNYWKRDRGLPIQVVARFSHTFGNTRVKGTDDNSSNDHINRLNK